MIIPTTWVWAEVDRRVPFASAYRPWVEPSLASVNAAATVNASGEAVVTDAVRAELADALLRRLGALGGPALLAAFRARGGDDYERFVGDAPCIIRRELPGLVRLIDTVCEQWVAYSCTLMSWLSTDMHRLSARAGTVTGMRLGLGDPHEGGRTVARIELDDGSRWALKPRSLQADVAFFGLLAQHPDLFEPQCIPTIVPNSDDSSNVVVEASSDVGSDIGAGAHGYMEWMDPLPVVDAAQSWRRTGRMLAAMHLVGAGDMHAENMVWRGSLLVPVDVEAAGSGAEAPAPTVARRWLEDSALRTEALPDLVSGPVAVTAGALLARGGQPTGGRGIRWANLGTSGITTERPMVVTPHLANEPRDASGRLVPFSVDDLVRGYDEALEVLATAASPHQQFADCPSRWVLRPTVAYLRRLEAATHPDALASLDALAAVQDSLPHRDPHWERVPAHLAAAIETAERAALRRMDVPVVRTIGDGVFADGRRIGTVPAPGPERIRARHAGWATDGRRRAEREAVRIIVAPYSPPRGESSMDGVGASPSWKHIASATAEQVVRTYLGPELRWLTGTVAGASARPWPAVAVGDLYNGSAGTAVFLAAAANAFAHDEAARLALQCVHDLVPSDDDPWLGTGWAGMAWAQAAVGSQLGRPDLVQRAANLLAERLPTTIEPHARLELLSGWGGVLAAAAAIANLGEHGVLRTRLARLADAYTDVLDRQLNEPATAWRLVRPGMAHGSFGVTLALGWLVAALHHLPSARGLDRLLDLEDHRIDADGTIGRSSADGAGQTGWCWGTAGYLVARSAPWIQPHRRGAQFRRAVTELGSVAPTLSQLCCGRIGHLAAFHSAAGIDPQVTASATEVEAVARNHWGVAAESDHGWAFEPRTDVWSPSLFRGAAGVGLVALQRVGHPVAMPWTLSFGVEPVR